MFKKIRKSIKNTKCNVPSLPCFNKTKNILNCGKQFPILNHLQKIAKFQPMHQAFQLPHANDV